jgi:copper oxidase (laccase) domain-containing protein
MHPAINNTLPAAHLSSRYVLVSSAEMVSAMAAEGFVPAAGPKLVDLRDPAARAALAATRRLQDAPVGEHAAVFVMGGKGAMFDLPRYLEDRLRAEGVGSVVNLSLCTFSDERRFFSYRRATHRREPDYGRLISAIALT